jgi:WXG100 family type VII secretion target
MPCARSAVAEAFRVDPQALADSVQRMADFGRYAESMLTEIDSLVANLHATWTGEGAAAHAEAHRHWARGEAMMREALAHLRTAGATAHRNYTGAVSTNLTMWS